MTIVGAGKVGRALGESWTRAGHQVFYGVRKPDRPDLVELGITTGETTRVMNITSALELGDVVLFAIPWASVPQVTTDYAAFLVDKILIDATNNFAGPIINNFAALEIAAPGAPIYRVFNSLGWEHFSATDTRAAPTDMFYCGPDGISRQLIESLIEDIGLRPVWVGENDRVHLVDNVGALWVQLANRLGWGRKISLKIADKDS